MQHERYLTPLSGTGAMLPRPAQGQVRLRMTQASRQAVALAGMAVIVCLAYGSARLAAGTEAVAVWSWLVLAGAGVVGYALSFVWLYELRYDAEGFTTLGWLMQRTRHSWHDLVGLRDTGSWLMVFRFADGTEVEVQKHIVGRARLIEVAHLWIQRNKAP